MLPKVRVGAFETNSSSSHAFALQVHKFSKFLDRFKPAEFFGVEVNQIPEEKLDGTTSVYFLRRNIWKEVVEELNLFFKSTYWDNCPVGFVELRDRWFRFRPVVMMNDNPFVLFDSVDANLGVKYSFLPISETKKEFKDTKIYILEGVIKGEKSCLRNGSQDVYNLLQGIACPERGKEPIFVWVNDEVSPSYVVEELAKKGIYFDTLEEEWV